MNFARNLGQNLLVLTYGRTTRYRTPNHARLCIFHARLRPRAPHRPCFVWGEYQVYGYSICHDENDQVVPCCSKWPNARPCDDAGTDGDVDGGTSDASDEGESDAGADDGGPPADEVCPWACTPVGGAGFDPFPSYVWFGEEDQTPPPALNGWKWESWVDLDLKEPTCPTCSCIAPTNPSDGCMLPAVWSVESKVCQEPSSPFVTPFDPPTNWTGSCTSTNPIAEGVLCNGEPCVKSLVLQPPTIAPCVAASVMSPGDQPEDILVHRRGIEYVSSSQGPACSSTSNCIAPPPTDYKLCFVANEVEVALPCPEGWTDRRTGWREVINTRSCSACSCGPHEGASCTVLASVYADDACTDERGNMTLTSTDAAQCIDLAGGTALRSKTAEVLSYQPGACAPSTSEVLGEVTLKHPVTYCCVPPLPTIP